MGESPATYEQADRIAALVRVVRARHLAHLRLTTEAMRDILTVQDIHERSRRVVVVFLHLTMSKTHPVTPECANQIITAAAYKANGIDWAATEFTIRWTEHGRFYLDTLSGGATFCMPVNLTADPVNVERHPNVYLAPATQS
ncbi:hypothetical protein [Micromonospora endolithica]|uniref:Uncharacterized protein n=1 Tax=Micromonospora endolithica TaxID=230091 RepID=A0A3A9ZQM2_9ACTN|nr:hypothetical protein [Micromonospora endolithica]RKN50471.1 hypothetical protein D7223_01355 [Micromonospora endolithica]TWJ20841.1 hypothetical protein JD76_00941 [Micromonospora endolithica]